MAASDDRGETMSERESLIASLRLKRGAPVWIRDYWRSVPIFHLWGEPYKAACGANLKGMGMGIPLKHAEKFARPCRDCVRRSAS